MDDGLAENVVRTAPAPALPGAPDPPDASAAADEQVTLPKAIGVSFPHRRVMRGVAARVTALAATAVVLLADGHCAVRAMAAGVLL
ncbi:hypothetical protein HCN51_46000 [Nonomuraea sp. FMUSA5-5]|uniref:Uncharacterized protein n=1 Tax=Nonomuraea composti TaxID=2720023 RepID=A0ABX1BJJ8_9ACTN|nr:hypothetical protein [Nonomuraea sp. FMUSA5-5]NJP96704.1 hypothetical protein [Nonomuraea sp. FMUSA5-5]